MSEAIDYREILREKLTAHFGAEASLRSLSKKLGFRSANFLSLILSGKRNLSLASATQIAKVLNLSSRDKNSLFALIAEATSPKTTSVASGTSLNIKRVSRPAHYHSWLNGVICEMTLLKDFTVSSESLVARLRGVADADSVKSSFEDLQLRKHIIPCSQKGWKKAVDTFESTNESRSLELQAIHQRYLHLAQHRLNSNITHREFQGLTIAIQQSRIPELKARIRQFIDDLDDEFTVRNEADKVFHIEVAAFQVLQEK